MIFIRAIQILMGIMMVVVLSACVETTVTGGFNVQVSDERALENYLALAAGYLELEDLVNAKRHLNNATDIDPNNSTAFGIWGLIYAREGDLDLAEESFRRAIRLDASNSQVRNNYAAFLFSNRNYEDAYTQLERVVEDTNYLSRPQAFENLGLSALQLNRLDDAEYAFGRALQLNPNQIRSSLELSEINLLKDNILQARAYYRNFLTTGQFFNLSQSARSLWIGIQLERALSNDRGADEYARELETRFVNSPEYQLYLQSSANE